MADEQDRPDEQPEGTPPPPAAKKVPAKKAPAKKAPGKKAPAKKAPPKKAPAAAAPPPPPAAAAPSAAAAQANGSSVPSDGAKEAAAQAKSTIDRADDSIAAPSLIPVPESGRSPLPLAVAVVVSLLAILLVRSLRRNDDD